MNNKIINVDKFKLGKSLNDFENYNTLWIHYTL